MVNFNLFKSKNFDVDGIKFRFTPMKYMDACGEKISYTKAFKEAQSGCRVRVEVTIRASTYGTVFKRVSEPGRDNLLSGTFEEALRRLYQKILTAAFEEYERGEDEELKKRDVLLYNFVHQTLCYHNALGEKRWG